MEKKKRKKRHYKGNNKKKIIVLVVLGTFLFVGMGFSVLGLQFDMDGTLEVGKYDKTLYGAIRREVKKDYASKYTGEHQDSMDPSKSTSDIYHYKSKYADGSDISNMNNVVFANTCWEMVRTTDTGGVRMLYNGPSEITEVNGTIKYKCSEDEAYFSEIPEEIDLKGTYLYGKSYNKTSSPGAEIKYELADTELIEITTSNAAEKIEYIKENYPYTCRNTSGKCSVGYQSTIHNVNNQTSGTKVDTYQMNYRNIIGSDKFNSNEYTPASAGYMYGDEYNITTFYNTTSALISNYIYFYNTTQTLGTTYYYSDGYDYGETTVNKYTLTNPQQITSDMDYNTLVGKYVINNAIESNKIYYVIKINNKTAYLKELVGGNKDVSMRFSDTITENSDGTYSLDNPTVPIEYKDIVANYENYNNKYTCGNSNSTCNNYRYIIETSNIRYAFTDGKITIAQDVDDLTLLDYVTIRKDEWLKGIDTTFKDYIYTCNNTNTTCQASDLAYILGHNEYYNYRYAQNYYCGKSVIYEDGKYKLQNIKNLEDLIDPSKIESCHYICKNRGEKECTNVYYALVNSISDGITSGFYAIEIKDGTISIEKAMENMFKKNTNDSIIKNDVEAWYENHLKNTEYESKIDDTIYCYDRSISNKDNRFDTSGWNSNGGGYSSGTLDFNEYVQNIEEQHQGLICTNIEDRYSVSNNKAKIKYKIGLPTLSDIKLVSTKGMFTRTTYWLGTPGKFQVERNRTNVTYGLYKQPFNYSESVSFNRINGESGIRPVISLVKGTEYESGTGSTTDPYIVNMNK